MKRSETVLIYGVTAVLAVILAVAIIFGTPETDGQGGSNKNRVANGGSTGGDIDLGAATSVVPGVSDPAMGSTAKSKPVGEFSILDAIFNGEDPVGSEVASAEGGMNGGAGSLGLEQPISPVTSIDDLGAGRDGSLMVPLRSVPKLTLADLGTQRTVERAYDGKRFRFVTIARGDALSELLLRWCPGTDRATVEALNETMNLGRLQYGKEICLPFYDDELLLEAFVERKQRKNEVPAASSTDIAGASGRRGAATAAATAGNADNSHLMRDGESLWTIAVAKVGAKKASAYIGEILKLNPSIVDASRVRAGNKILLPN